MITPLPKIVKITSNGTAIIKDETGRLWTTKELCSRIAALEDQLKIAVVANTIALSQLVKDKEEIDRLGQELKDWINVANAAGDALSEINHAIKVNVDGSDE